MKKLAVLILVLGLVVVSCGKKEETVSVAPVAVESVVAEVEIGRASCRERV